MGVFIAAFIAATVLPFSSEVVVSGDAAGADMWQVLIWARWAIGWRRYELLLAEHTGQTSG